MGIWAAPNSPLRPLGPAPRATGTISLLLALGCLLPALSPAQTSTSGATFLSITPSVRAYGLGMASGITALGAEAIDSNVANLGVMPQRFDVFTSYAALMNNTQYEHIATSFVPAFSFPAIDTLGFSFTRLETSGIPGADAQGNVTDSSYGSGNNAIAISGSGAVTSDLRLGLTAKVVQLQIANYSSNLAPAGDVGMTYTFSNFDRPVSIGASLTNAGSGVKFIQQTDRLPTAANVGAALPLGPVMVVFEVNRLIYEQETQIGTGAEYTIGPVSFRAGYVVQRQSGNLDLQDTRGTAERIFASGLTAGLGIKFGSAKFDYAFSNQAVDLGMTQRIALSFEWGDRSSRPDIFNTSWTIDTDKSGWMVKSLGDGKQ